MSFDTLMMKAVTEELQNELAGSVVQRVYEPERGEIVIHLYTGGRQPGLLFSFDSRYARVHTVGKRYQSLEQPSPFCMLLRKYLVGARPVTFSNPPLERILEIVFEPAEGMKPVKLIAEIMSRRSNLVLVNEEQIILGAAKTASWDKNPARAILPGEIYRQPPIQDKLNPLETTLEEFKAAFTGPVVSGDNLRKTLVNTVNGISPLIATELLHRSSWDSSDPEKSIKKLYSEIRPLFSFTETDFKPVLVPSRNIYAATVLNHLPKDEQVSYSSPSKLLEDFYDRAKYENRERALRGGLHSAVDRRLSLLLKKKKQQVKERDAAANADQYRLYGETLLAYGDQVTKGAESAVFPNIYNPDEEIVVPLNPSKSASFNAQNFFKRYRKAKQGQEKIRRQLAKTKAEIEYCRGLLYTIEENDEASLEEIRREMVQIGYIREKKKDKRIKESLPQPLTFKTSSGCTVLVGRNNRQNDYITFKAAVRRDTWFHVRQMPGSHVILKEAPFPPPPDDIEEAAFLAAYFSKGRNTGAVEVDYSAVRHVRRRPGGKPGFVFYENYETITVNPQDQNFKERFLLT